MGHSTPHKVSFRLLVPWFGANAEEVTSFIRMHYIQHVHYFKIHWPGVYTVKIEPGKDYVSPRNTKKINILT